MPTDKDFKRLVRARMGKTGEAYTTARAHLRPDPDPARPAQDREPAGRGDADARRARSMAEETGHPMAESLALGQVVWPDPSGNPMTTLTVGAGSPNDNRTTSQAT